MRYLTYTLLLVTFLTWAGAGRADDSAFEFESEGETVEFTDDTTTQSPPLTQTSTLSQDDIAWPGMPFDNAGPNESLQ